MSDHQAFSSSISSTINRRTLLVQSALLLAGVSSPFAHAKKAGASTEALWAAELAKTDGSMQKMQDYRQKRPLLINFWASWCAPCIEELPLLNSLLADFETAGWEMLGIAVDTPANVKRFTARTSINFETVIAGSPGIRLSRELGNTSGGLPFTVVLDSGGNIADSHAGLLKEDLLKEWLQRVK